MTDTFYRDFDAKVPRDPAIIPDRSQVYDAFLKSLAALDEAPGALDLGCGRGEWLRHLADLGFQARGVDLDDSVLEIARAAGLDVETEDALAALKTVPDATLAVVSGIHLIEHLSFDTVRAILGEARRVLRPGGIMILETSNPDAALGELAVALLDPTHVGPVPALLAGFVTEHAGFARYALLPLNGAGQDLYPTLALAPVLRDKSPDYAMVAQVDGPDAAALDGAFEKAARLDLRDGLGRYDTALQAQINAPKRTLKSHKQAISRLKKENDAVLEQLSELRKDITVLQGLVDRTWLDRMLCRRSTGRPTKVFRTILFHKNGKPRGVARRWVFKSDGTPRPTFKRWMTSAEYQSLPWPSRSTSFAPSEPHDPLLDFDPNRPRPEGLPELVMTIEELVAKAGRAPGTPTGYRK